MGLSRSEHWSHARNCKLSKAVNLHNIPCARISSSSDEKALSRQFTAAAAGLELVQKYLMTGLFSCE
jgi:hypothetical protein